MLPRLKAWIELRDLVAAFAFWKQTSILKFEGSFAKLSQQRYSIAFPYGRTGLFCLLKGVALEGREVICPAYTCIVVPHAIVTAGAEPVFVDSKPEDFNMDWNLVEQAVTEKTGAVVATSIFGQPVNNDDVARFKQKYPDIYIFQDCAHSFFAGREGELVNLNCDAAFYGLNISKIITSVFGGMVTVDSSELRNKIIEAKDKYIQSPSIMKSLKRLLYLIAIWGAFNSTVYGFINRLERTGFLNRFVKYFDETVIDMPPDYTEGLTPLEARVGIVQCEKYQSIVEHRRVIAAVYAHRLGEISELSLPVPCIGHTYSHYVIKVNSAQNIIEYMRGKGYQLGELIDYFIPDLKCYENYRFIGMGCASKWPGSVINLPVHVGCSVEKAHEICDLIESFFEN